MVRSTFYHNDTNAGIVTGFARKGIGNQPWDDTVAGAHEMGLIPTAGERFQ
jgi:hypothetical protein